MDWGTVAKLATALGIAPVHFAFFALFAFILWKVIQIRDDVRGVLAQHNILVIDFCKREGLSHEEFKLMAAAGFRPSRKKSNGAAEGI